MNDDLPKGPGPDAAVRKVIQEHGMTCVLRGLLHYLDSVQQDVYVTVLYGDLNKALSKYLGRYEGRG